MAKYSRFDPRNKKSGRHKFQSIEKNFKIKNVDSSKKNYLHSLHNSIEYSYNEGEYDVEQFEQSDLN